MASWMKALSPGVAALTNWCKPGLGPRLAVLLCKSFSHQRLRCLSLLSKKSQPPSLKNSPTTSALRVYRMDDSGNLTGTLQPDWAAGKYPAQMLLSALTERGFWLFRPVDWRNSGAYRLEFEPAEDAFPASVLYCGQSSLRWRRGGRIKSHLRGSSIGVVPNRRSPARRWGGPARAGR